MMMKKSTAAVIITFYFALFNLLLQPISAVEPDFSGPHRKHLTYVTNGPAATDNPNRGNTSGIICSPNDIVVSQGPTSPLPGGIPTYTVEISNISRNGRNISHIHLRCGSFMSARMIDPKIFRRVSFDDCLVNNGRSILSGRSLSFKYANTFPYKLTVRKVNCA